MKNHTPKKCNLYYLSFYGQFSTSTGGVGWSWMDEEGGGGDGGDGRAENRHFRATIPTPLKEYLRMDS